MQVWRQGRVRAVERVRSPSDADALVLLHLARLGCDPTQPRECRHYLYVPAEIDADAVATTLMRDGWDAETEDVGATWLVTGTTMTSLDNERVRATRGRLEQLAAHHGGHYDGWEAAAD